MLACEAHHLEPDDFSWSPARAKGSVAHKAIQLLLNWRGEPAPADVVDEALARLADEERSIGDYVAGLSEGEAADLRSQSVDLVTKFIECFPPLDRRWHPVTEAAAHHPVDGPIVLRARVDLVIGKPHGSEARKVIIDLKSGRVVDRHRQDLRFYALVETLCRGVPPRLLASFALDAGRPVVEVVTPALLRSTLRRTLDADRTDGRTAHRRPGSPPSRRTDVSLVSAAARLRRRAGRSDRRRRAARRPRPQVSTRTASPTARWSHTATASSGRSRMQPLDSPNRSGAPTDSSGWASVPSP